MLPSAQVDASAIKRHVNIKAMARDEKFLSQYGEKAAYVTFPSITLVQLSKAVGLFE